jgi:ribonuclease D
MTKPDFILEFIKESSRLSKLCAVLLETPAFALDIETTQWWNRQRERIALIQIAFRRAGQIKVAVIDALAGFDLSSLGAPLGHNSTVKIVHNAGFDASRLAAHYDFQVSPVFDTMLAARRSGERKYSLKAQAASHLNLTLDKSARQSDWSRRPLDKRQLYYAALDPFAAQGFSFQARLVIMSVIGDRLRRNVESFRRVYARSLQRNIHQPESALRSLIFDLLN